MIERMVKESNIDYAHAWGHRPSTCGMVLGLSCHETPGMHPGWTPCPPILATSVFELGGMGDVSLRAMDAAGSTEQQDSNGRSCYLR